MHDQTLGFKLEMPVGEIVQSIILYLFTIQIVLAESKCRKDEIWRCNNGKYIQPHFVCDEEEDCGDGSDEKDCNACGIKGRFKCGNGKCVLSSDICDGHDDCKDNTDEQKCKLGVCRSDKFKCRNGRCINLQYRCDGDNDCKDNSDEENCGIRVCLAGQFKCENGRRCLPPRYLCDGDDDCGDNSDEGSCTTATTKPSTGRCRTSQFTCNDGTCVGGLGRCDGEKDCPDGSDEDNCISGLCVPGNKEQWRCDNGICVSGSFRCDGGNDCEDNSDELNCESRCPGAQWRCKNRKCIVSTYRCDGDNDCGDNSDEMDCAALDVAKFKTLEVTVDTIEHDCEGESSLLGCTNASHIQVNTTDIGDVCNAAEWECINRKCISIGVKCNGIDDCGDGSDELECVGENDEVFQTLKISVRIIENDCGNNKHAPQCAGRTVQCDYICESGNPGRMNEIVGRCCRDASRSEVGHCREGDIAYCGEY